MSDDISLLDYLERGGRIASPDNAPARYRAELMRIMASFVDSELAGAAGFADLINEGPGVVERIVAARIVLEKLGHGERVLKIMGEFGADQGRYFAAHPWCARIERNEDLGAERRVAGDMRLNVFHYPLKSWADAVVMNTLMGKATVIQLTELSYCSYQPLADAFLEILPREERHADLGREGLDRLVEQEGAAGDIRALAEYWRPRVAASFGGADSQRFDLLKRFGLRREKNEALLAEWTGWLDELLASLG